MRIVVGSKNPAKISAVQEIVQDYPHLKDAEIVTVEVDSGTDDQPVSLDRIVTGAITRARNAYNDCDYSIGLESGLMPVPATKSGYMDIGVCAIYDGKEFHLGLSPAFECPDPQIFKSVVEEGINLSEAMKRSGLTQSEYVGWQEGSIGILTKGRMTRKDQTLHSIRTALIHVDP